MTMMIDVACPKCSRRFGWAGSMRNRPPCPRCGYRPPQEELDAAADKVDALRERLRTHPADAGAEMRRQQRIDAGLTLRQAAKLIGIGPVDLSAYEQGKIALATELLDKIAEVYGVGKE